MSRKAEERPDQSTTPVDVTETLLEVSPKYSESLPPTDVLLPSISPILRQPTYPYYTAGEIAKVDFPTEIKLSIFMQLKKLILTFGQSVCEECVIAKFVTFEEWNRLQGYYDDVKVDMEIKIGDEQQIEEWIDISSITYIDHRDLNITTRSSIDSTVPSSTQSLSPSFSSSLTTTPSISVPSSPTPSTSDLIQPYRKASSASIEILIHSHNAVYKSDLLQRIFHFASVRSYYRPDKGQYFTRVTLPVPDVESIENLMNWVIGGDDENWVASIRPWSVWKTFKNVCWLGLRDEAEQLLIRYVDEMESKGIYISDYIPPEEFIWNYCDDTKQSFWAAMDEHDKSTSEI